LLIRRRWLFFDFNVHVR